MRCPTYGTNLAVKALREAFGVSKTEGAVLAQLYAAFPHVRDGAELMANAGRSHRADIAHVHVGRLRKRLGTDAIERVRTSGWRLSGRLWLECVRALDDGNPANGCADSAQASLFPAGR